MPQRAHIDDPQRIVSNRHLLLYVYHFQYRDHALRSSIYNLPETPEAILCEPVSTVDTDGQTTGQQLQRKSFKHGVPSLNSSAAEAQSQLGEG